MLLNFLRSVLTSSSRPNIFIFLFIRSVGHEYVPTKTNGIKLSK